MSLPHSTPEAVPPLQDTQAEGAMARCCARMHACRVIALIAFAISWLGFACAIKITVAPGRTDCFTEGVDASHFQVGQDLQYHEQISGFPAGVGWVFGILLTMHALAWRKPDEVSGSWQLRSCLKEKKSRGWGYGALNFHAYRDACMHACSPPLHGGRTRAWSWKGRWRCADGWLLLHLNADSWRPAY